MKISASYPRFYLTVLASLLVFSMRDIFAQDLGTLARQERARRQARQSRVTKVFTNEDLQREVIITEEMRAEMEQQAAAALAENASEPASGQPVPVHLTLAPPALPSREAAAPVKSLAERAVPTVPLWPAAMPLGDIARHYRQQIAPQIPATDDPALSRALANAPLARDHAAERLELTLAPPAAPRTPAPPAPRRALSELQLPAPFVMATVEGAGAPLIENVAQQEVPGFPSPAVHLQLAEAVPAAPETPRGEEPRFAAPELGDVMLTFGADAALGIPSLLGEEPATPAYDSGREPLVIRFQAPRPAPAIRLTAAPAVRAAEQIAEPGIQAAGGPTAGLEFVSPWRYADEMPAAPPAQMDAARSVLASTTAAAPAQSATEPAFTTIGPEAAEALEVRVGRGDSLWKLAQRHLGDGHAWPRIAAANPLLANPHHIRAGERLRIPGASLPAGSAMAARAGKPAVASTNAARTVTVRKGDSLWKLAESTLGSGAAWNCIAEANPQITDADHIYAGQSLVLPANCNPQS